MDRGRCNPRGKSTLRSRPRDLVAPYHLLFFPKEEEGQSPSLIRGRNAEKEQGKAMRILWSCCNFGECE